MSEHTLKKSAKQVDNILCMPRAPRSRPKNHCELTIHIVGVIAGHAAYILQFPYAFSTRFIGSGFRQNRYHGFITFFFRGK
jgi:hypothetical protein